MLKLYFDATFDYIRSLFRSAAKAKRPSEVQANITASGQREGSQGRFEVVESVQISSTTEERKGDATAPPKQPV